jgi:hypothetical protein
MRLLGASPVLQRNDVAGGPAGKQYAIGAAAWLLRKKPATSAGKV